jgi:hypothetical protein
MQMKLLFNLMVAALVLLPTITHAADSSGDKCKGGDAKACFQSVQIVMISAPYIKDKKTRDLLLASGKENAKRGCDLGDDTLCADWKEWDGVVEEMVKKANKK